MRLSGDRLWTDEERHLLRRYAGVLSTSEIAKKLNRRPGGVHMKAFSMGLSLRLLGEKHPQHVYSDAQIEQAVNQHYDGSTVKQAAVDNGINFHFLKDVVRGKRRRIGVGI